MYAIASTAFGRKPWHSASWSSTVGDQAPVGSHPTSAKSSAPASCARSAQARSGCPTPSGLSPSRSRSTDLALGVAPSIVVASSGASWPWVIIVRSPASDTETVTGVCQRG